MSKELAFGLCETLNGRGRGLSSGAPTLPLATVCSVSLENMLFG